MKINLPLLKLVIRLIILMILFVVLFLISAFLYSARYWPDIYNYVNANITITRIPTLSELNLTIIEVEYGTEMYSTTDFDYSDSTNAFDTTEDYAFSFDEFDFPKAKVRRNAKLEDLGKDFAEVPKKAVLVDYFFMDEEGTKIIKDLVDESKLTTRDSKDVEIMSTGLVGVEKMVSHYHLIMSFLCDVSHSVNLYLCYIVNV